MNWEDIRYVRAIHQTRTVTAAAIMLGVDQTTVSRRLKKIEAALGQTLFNRGGGEMISTGFCDELMADARKMQLAFLSLSERIATYGDDRVNVVRISAMPWIVNHIFMPHLADFYADHPKIAIDSVSSVRDRNRNRGEVDMSLRFEILPGSRDVCRPIAKIPYSVYAKRGLPADELSWIGFGSDMWDTRPARWFKKNVKQISLLVNDAGAMLHAIESGAGKGLLPDFLGRLSTKLERISTTETPELIRVLRVMINPELSKLRHIKEVLDWLFEVMQKSGFGMRGR